MKTVLTALLLFLNLSCGTGTGNPELVGANPSQGSAVNELVLTSICTVLSNCRGLPVAECSTGLREQRTFGPRLGLAPTNQDSLAELISKSSSGVLNTDRVAALSCQSEINALTCDAPAVQNAYRPELADPLLHSSEMLGPSCQSVLSE